MKQGFGTKSNTSGPMHDRFCGSYHNGKAYPRCEVAPTLFRLRVSRWYATGLLDIKRKRWVSLPHVRVQEQEAERTLHEQHEIEDPMLYGLEDFGEARPSPSRRCYSTRIVREKSYQIWSSSHPLANQKGSNYGHLSLFRAYFLSEPRGTRTLNPLIKSQLLCQLS